MLDSKEVVLFLTSNYKLFTTHDFNRDVKQTGRLKESMEKYGFLPSHPLFVCVGKNGTLTILEGHHRFEVARELGLPVYYSVTDSNKIRPTDIPGERPWSTNDCLEAYCREGKYTDLREYHQRTGIPIKSCLSILNGSNGLSAGELNKAFRKGTFIVGPNGRRLGELVYSIIRVVERINPRVAKHSQFVTAIAKMIRLKEFSSTRLINKIGSHPFMVTPQPDRISYEKMIESVYNRNTGDKIPLSHLSGEFDRKQKRKRILV